MAADWPTNEECIALFKEKSLRPIFRRSFRKTIATAVQDAKEHAVAGRIDEAVSDVLLAGFVEVAQEKLGL
ncbi:MAG: hypothetical protein Q7R73_04115 [bacterium]|nr:hypothetical protein [bacterium]